MDGTPVYNSIALKCKAIQIHQPSSSLVGTMQIMHHQFDINGVKGYG